MKNKIQWQPVIEICMIIFTTLGTTIALYLHTDGKIDAYQARTESIIGGIRQDIMEFHAEMRDFHGRLCAIEERNIIRNGEKR